MRWCWRRGSNEKPVLKTRKLLILKRARTARTASSVGLWHVYGTRSTRAPTPSKSTLAGITFELDFARAYARTAEIAFSAGDTPNADKALRNAWSAWERAAREALKHEAETLYPTILGVEWQLRSLEARPLTKAARAG